jgi:hypothetical protein
MRAFYASLVVASLIVGSCGGGAASRVTSTTSSSGSGAATGSGGSGGGAGGGADAGKEAGPVCVVSDAPFDAGVVAAASCSATPPPGAPTPPPPKSYTGGTCPALVAGTNNLTSTGNARSFLLAVPKNLQPTEHLPVIFLWYWLRGSAQDFYTVGDVQNAVDEQRFLAVIPNAKGDLFENWPFLASDGAARRDEEFSFFDDMLSCVSAQFDVNPSCVSSAGVSAGALFTDQLVGVRSEYLSSFISLSGGVGGLLVAPWTPPTHPLPAIVLWGGADDECLGIKFQAESQALEQGIDAQCSFMVECVHNCGHSEPPFTPAQGMSTYGALWQFALDHPYWLPTGASPYTTNGLPSGMPSWCAIGAGNAVPRTGACGPSGC